ncbi:MAG: hypothetical protein IJK42_09505 [Prevotella sp.]|nr:hypothetical protein [Prevotella sp.]
MVDEDAAYGGKCPQNLIQNETKCRWHECILKNFENDFVEFLRIAHPINIYWSVHPFLLFHDLAAGGYADPPLQGVVSMYAKL